MIEEDPIKAQDPKEDITAKYLKAYGDPRDMGKPAKVDEPDVFNTPELKELSTKFGYEPDVKRDDIKYSLFHAFPTAGVNDNSVFGKVKQTLWSYYRPSIETAKVPIRTVEQVLSGASGMIAILGDVMHQSEFDKEARRAEGFDEETIARWDTLANGVQALGEKGKTFFNSRMETGWEAADQRIYGGELHENFSYERVVGGVVGGITSVGIAYLGGTTMRAFGASKGVSVLAGASILGFTETEDVYWKVRENMMELGMSEDKARASALATYGLTAAAFTALENIQFNRWLEGGTGYFWTDIIRNMATEGIEEATQTLLHNAVNMTLGGDEEQKLWQGFIESVLVGALTGGVFGGMSSNKVNQIDTIIRKAKAAGGVTDADISQMLEIAGEVLKKNKGKIDALSKERFGQLAAEIDKVNAKQAKAEQEKNVKDLQKPTPVVTVKKEPLVVSPGQHPGNSESVIKYLNRYLTKETIEGLSATERMRLYNSSTALRDFSQDPEAFPETRKKVSNAVAEIDKALEQGLVDQGTADLAKYLVTEVNPDFDADATIEFVYEVTDSNEIFAKEKLATAEQLAKSYAEKYQNLVSSSGNVGSGLNHSSDYNNFTPKQPEYGSRKDAQAAAAAMLET